MDQLTQRSPEDQKVYDDTMAQLEAQAGAPAVDEPVVEASPAQDAPVEEAKPPVETEVEKVLRLELERSKRESRKHQQAVSKMAREFDSFKRAQQVNEHKAQRPVLLDQVEGLESAIQHVYRAPVRDQLPEEQPFGPNWQSTVLRAIPDIDSLLNNPNFSAKAAELRDMNDWTDPVIAIRDLADLRTNVLTTQSANAAADQARKDFEASHKKLTAQTVPSGRGSQPPKPAAQTDDVKRWETMSSEDFRKEVARVQGF